MAKAKTGTASHLAPGGIASRTATGTARLVPRGWGHYLPERVITNDALSQTLDTSDEWIRQRTGIRQRHIAADDETTLTLAEKASQQALSNAGWQASDVDLILVATATPDRTFPSVSCLLQESLGCRAGGAAFDLQAACSGFVYGLALADSLAKSGNFEKILLVGSETFSRILDWQDRRTAVLFGDGAGAVACEVLRGSNGSTGTTSLQGVSNATEAVQGAVGGTTGGSGGNSAPLASGTSSGTSSAKPSATPSAKPSGAVEALSGVLSTHLFADGKHADALRASGGISLTRTAGVVEMDGREVYRHAVVRMAEAIEVALATHGLTSADIDWFVPHQANLRLMETMADRLRLPREQMLAPVVRHANTSAASIPLAISEAAAEGKFQSGDLLLLEALGAGFTWGSALLRW